MRVQQIGDVQTRLRFSPCQRLDLVEAHALVVQQRSHAVGRFLVQLDRRQEEVAGRHGRDDADVRVRMGVDHAHIELVIDRLQEVAQVVRKRRVLGRLTFEPEQRIGGGHQHEAVTRHLRARRGHQQIGGGVRQRGALRLRDRTAEIPLVVEVDRQNAVPLPDAVLSQQGRDGRLADTSLLVRENEGLHGLLLLVRTGVEEADTRRTRRIVRVAGLDGRGSEPRAGQAGERSRRAEAVRRTCRLDHRTGSRCGARRNAFHGELAALLALARKEAHDPPGIRTITAEHLAYNAVSESTQPTARLGGTQGTRHPVLQKPSSPRPQGLRCPEAEPATSNGRGLFLWVGECGLARYSTAQRSSSRGIGIGHPDRCGEQTSPGSGIDASEQQFSNACMRLVHPITSHSLATPSYQPARRMPASSRLPSVYFVQESPWRRLLRALRLGR